MGKKMSVFVHTQGIKTVHAGCVCGGGGRGGREGGRGGKKKQNCVHVVVEWGP